MPGRKKNDSTRDPLSFLNPTLLDCYSNLIGKIQIVGRNVHSNNSARIQLAIPTKLVSNRSIPG